TYFGYILLYFAMMAILFAKGTRFADLKRSLEKVKSKKAKILSVLMLCFGLIGFSQEHAEHDGHDHGQESHVHAEDDSHNHGATAPAQEHFDGDGHDHKPAEVAFTRPTKKQIDSVIKANIIPKSHADKFGELVIQDYSGRMMPVNTFASEILRKLSKRDHYEEFDANQVLLSMQESPLFWYNVPIIYLEKRKGDSIRHIIGVDESEKYFSITDFLTDDGRNKLGPYLKDAYAAKVPNGYQMQLKGVYDRMSLLFGTLDGRSMKIFPVPDDEVNTWISPVEYREDYKTKIKDTLYGKFIQNSFGYYLSELSKARQDGDYTTADRLLKGFKKNQKQQGSEVVLSDEKIKAEILYNKYDIFKTLYSYYLLIGLVLFILLIVQIFRAKSKLLNVIIKLLAGSIFLLFVLHTGGLILRWFVSGHAPWSNGYESMIYIAWATMFFGLAFGRKSMLTLAATSFVTAMLLFVAHMNWADPAIGNLQPVLDSYWLMIHVAVIVAAYGPLALGMILGFTVLLLMIFTTKSNKTKMDLNIKELTLINEMALTVGLVMFTIGNFLGGMWANESWGRYWGWDPKETWALISIMIYAFVLHMRLIPGLRGRFGFNLASVIAFSSMCFTYFGVNFYLAGLHSYQAGQQILSYKYIAITIAVLSIIASLAYRKYAKYYRK
ncbi:cytochrome c biogenesis protein CcsA, partial [Psychroserpens sp.]|uniref:cytochrome c biogenesis protein CcsA n=1 Tax=Psychroserpens sp. TaxID=2020870 RepID=UPI003C71556F